MSQARGKAGVVVRRAAGCLLALVVLSLGLATAGTGYLVEQRSTDGRWGGALAWCAATLVLGLVVLSLTAFARELLGRGGPKDPSSQPGGDG